jgi:hypothetical protein
MSDENFPFSKRAPREGEPWMPEERLLILVEPLSDGGGVPPAAFEAFEAVRQLREAAVDAVVAFPGVKPAQCGPNPHCACRVGSGTQHERRRQTYRLPRRS